MMIMTIMTKKIAITIKVIITMKKNNCTTTSIIIIITINNKNNNNNNKLYNDNNTNSNKMTMAIMHRNKHDIYSDIILTCAAHMR